MKLFFATTYLMLEAVGAQTQQMVKMCLFYGSPSGHARVDPIIDQTCSSGHVHTFYGPQDFHPAVTYEELRDTRPEFSSTPVVENESLYWHPSIYEVVENNGVKTYTRVNDLETSPYYRWDKSVLPAVEAFPPQFRMIAASNDPGANLGGENGSNMFTECCDFIGNDEEQCESWDRLEFPNRNCAFLGIAFAMPTCWNGNLGIDNDHKSHMAYTTNGNVNGPCPSGFNRRVPQVQLFTRINNYRGASRSYELSDGQSEFHVDFFNGWQEGKLEQIIRDCEFTPGQEDGEYNPPCDCDQFLTPNPSPSGAVCDGAVRNLIIDEETAVVTGSLPRDACQGPPLKQKFWNELSNGLLDCTLDPTPVPPPTPVAPTPPTSPTPATSVPATPVPSISPTFDNDEDGGDDEDGDEDCDEGEDCEDEDDEDDSGEGEDEDDEDEDDDSEDEDEDEGDEDEDEDEDDEGDFEELEDDPGFRFRGVSFKNCAWVADRASVRCGRSWRGTPVYEFCPASCAPFFE